MGGGFGWVVAGVARLRWMHSRARAPAPQNLADSFYYCGLEFAAVGAAEVEFVTSETHGDWIARLPLAGNVAIGRGGFVFAGVDHALEVDDDGAAKVSRS